MCITTEGVCKLAGFVHCSSTQLCLLEEQTAAQTLAGPLHGQLAHTTTASEWTTQHRLSKRKYCFKDVPAHKFQEDVVRVEYSSFADSQSLGCDISFKEITIQKRMLDK